MSEHITPIQIEVLLQHYGWASLASETETDSADLSAADELSSEDDEENPILAELFRSTSSEKRRSS